jgi:CelD/BcsL family acetyltransferase involved in cellulose biosynthesis
MSKKARMTVNITPFNLSNKAETAIKWQTLESRANNSIFLSWLWIGSWLDIVTDKLFMVECFHGEEIVGLAFFVERTRKAFGVMPVKQWHLHRTGVLEQDQIWIEHNDFLLASSVENEAREQMIEAIYHYDNSTKEIIVGLSSEKLPVSFRRYFPHARTLIKTQGYLVDIPKIPSAYSNDVLSKNTRSQIRRSEKLLSQQGELTFNIISNQDKLKETLKHIGDIHKQRWQHTEEGSGFTNDLFVNFHQALMRCSDNQAAEIAILSLNNKPIGYLLNYVYKETVSFYLSALTVLEDNKVKVGLTLHSKAIEHYIDQGAKIYDFLGGEARYKQSLSNKQYDLALFSFFKNNPVLWLESKLKDFKTMCKRVISK